MLAAAGPDRGDARQLQQRARRPAHRAARRPPAPGSSWSRWAPAASATSPTCARSPRRRSPPCSTSAPPTSGEFGSREAIAQTKGEIVEALRRRRRGRAQRRRRAGGRDAAPHPRPGAHLRWRRRRRLARRRDRRPRPAVVRPRARRRVAPRRAHARRAPTRSPTPRRPPRSPSPSACRSTRSPPRSAAPRPPRRWRMELHERADGVVVVNDAYNANPDSMEAALDTVAAMGRRRGARTVAVLGEMRELGDESAEAGTAASAASPRPPASTWSSPWGRWPRPSPRVRPTHPGWAGATVVTAGRDEALAWVRHNVAAGDVVLVKASRGAALELLADALPGGAPRRESHPVRRRSRAPGLPARHPGRDQPADPARLRPGDPRRRAHHPPHQARHADHGRHRDHPGHAARLPRRQADQPGPALGVRPAAALPLRRHRPGRLPRRLHQDREAAQPRPAQQGQDDRPHRRRA